MAAPGQRRLTLLPALLVLSLFLPWVASGASAVLGVDLGTEYIKAALVKPGIPLEIVLTKDSKRKEVSAIALKPAHNAKANSFPERVYGSDAVALAARIPNDVYPNLRPLLGQLEDQSTQVEQYRKRHPALELVGYGDRGTVAFRSAAFGKEEEPFTVEELLAMELQNVRTNAEALAGKTSKIENVVITVPSFYTADELRAVEVASELAGLNVLGLISNGLAVGVNYATSRTFPSVAEGGKAEYHLIYDMGAGSTSATVLQFQGKMVKDVGKLNKTIQEVSVLGTGYDRLLGGDALNAVIVDHMVDEFVKTPTARKQHVAHESVQAHGRAAAKLWKEAERVRQVLSANSETMASFEGLYDDIDFRYKLTRAQLEDLAGTFAERVEVAVQQALNAAKLIMADLDSVILHGGATRTPFVQARLEKVLGGAGKIRTNVNADEAAVFGAAFKGAGLSPSFRVKEIQTRDGTPYSVGVRWSVDGKERYQKLFVPTSQRGVEKHVPFKNLQDFEFAIYQQEESNEQGGSKKEATVARIQTRNLTASVAHLTEKMGCAASNVSTSFAVRLSLRDGLLEVVSGSVSCSLEGVEKKGGVVDDVKGFFGFGGKNDEQKPMQQPAEGSSSTSSTQGESKTASTVTQAETKASDASGKSKKRQPAKPKVESVPLDFTTELVGTPSISTAELQRMQSRLAAFDASDRSRRLREESLNTLEAFIYRTRDLLTEQSFVEASSDSERSELEKKLASAGDWLYGEGAEAIREDLKTRLKQLRDLVDPVEQRREEAVKRPKAVELLKDVVNQTKMLADAVRQQVDSAREAAASAVSSVTGEPSTASATDDFAELEDAPSSMSSAAPAEPSASSETLIYTADDVSTLTAAYESVQEWLQGKLAEQDKLSSRENPVILSTDIEAKAKELRQVVMDLVEKRMRKPTKKKSSTKANTKTKKAKGDKSKKAEPSGTVGDAETADQAQPEAMPEPSNTETVQSGPQSPVPGDQGPAGQPDPKMYIHDEL